MIWAETPASFEVRPECISMSASEGVLEEGDVVAVYGVGEWDRNPARGRAANFAGYREAPRRLIMRARVGLRLYIRKID